MKTFCVVISLYLVLAQSAYAADLSINLLLRYENETNQLNLSPRKRVRAIGTIGVSQAVNKNWSVSGQLSTGLKNKQNVPAITLHQFTDQPEGDKDVFLSRLYTQAKFNQLELYIGKIPWKTAQTTDLFWDRHLNPIGLHLNYTLDSGDNIKLASFKPLDGATSTVGHMTILQYQKRISTDLGLLTIAPWLVDYQGQAGAEYAKKDTAHDNQFVRFSGTIKRGPWQFGADIGWSLQDVPNEYAAEFANQRLSYAFELKHGKLKNVGDQVTQLRYMYVERFSVITEFAQNAISRFATSNFKGWDLRMRYRVSKNCWIGGRLSQTQKLLGAPEQGVRFRLETKYSF